MAPSSRPQPIVSIVARPDTPSAWIWLVGEIDLAVEPALNEAADRLRGLVLRFIVIDLAAVTFACSTFSNFLAALHRAHPDAGLVLRHPPRTARIVVAATGLDGLVTMSGHPVSPVRSPDMGSTPQPSTAGCTTAIVPLNVRYPSGDDRTMRNPPDRWGTINRQPGRVRCSGGPGLVMNDPTGVPDLGSDPPPSAP